MSLSPISNQIIAHRTAPLSEGALSSLRWRAYLPWKEQKPIFVEIKAAVETADRIIGMLPLRLNKVINALNNKAQTVEAAAEATNLISGRLAVIEKRFGDYSKTRLPDPNYKTELEFNLAVLCNLKERHSELRISPRSEELRAAFITSRKGHELFFKELDHLAKTFNVTPADLAKLCYRLVSGQTSAEQFRDSLAHLERPRREALFNFATSDPFSALYSLEQAWRLPWADYHVLHSSLDNTERYIAPRINTIVEANMPLVPLMLKQLGVPYKNYEEAFEEASIILFRTARFFDPLHGFRFSTYACKAIANGISRGFEKKFKISQKVLPLPLIDEEAPFFLSYDHELGAVRSETSRNVIFPDEENFVDSPRKGALNNLIDPADGEVRRSDFDSEGYQFLREELQEALEFIEPRKRHVLEMRFGLNDYEPMTLQEVGKKLGVTKERARQIEAQGIRDLKRMLAGERNYARMGLPSE